MTPSPVRSTPVVNDFEMHVSTVYPDRNDFPNNPFNLFYEMRA